MSVSGPLETGQVYLLTQIKSKDSKKDEVYTLRPDPNPKFPPYFGRLTSDNSGNVLPLQLTVVSGNPPTYTLLTSGGMGFTEDTTTNNIMLAQNSGSFTYNYPPIDSQTVTSGTPLVADFPVSLMVGSDTLRFSSKTPKDEEEDQKNATDSNYMPTYDLTNIQTVFFIPEKTRPKSNCQTIDSNVAFADIAADNKGTNFTNEEWCKNDITYISNPLCTNSNDCGTEQNKFGPDGKIKSDTATCYGPCTDNKCNPIKKHELSCDILVGGLTVLDWVLIIGGIIIGVIILVLIIYFIV